RESLLQLLQARLHAVDDRFRVLAVARHDDSADDFALAVLLEQAAADVAPELHGADGGHVDRRAAGGVDDDALEIGDALHVADAAHDVLGLVDLNQSPADVVVRAPHGVDDSLERYSARGHLDRIEIDLILLHESA